MNPATLSELGAASSTTLTYFRTVLWVCGPLFAITMIFFVLPKIEFFYLNLLAYSFTIVNEILLGVFPAIGKTRRLHDLLAFVMAASMLIMAYLFAFSLEGNYTTAQLVMAASMTVLGILGLLDRKNFIFYELSFIFTSHFTILTAVLALS